MLVKLLRFVAERAAIDTGVENTMANLKTAKQRMKTNEAARQRNIAVKSRVRSFVKAAETALESGDATVSGTALKNAMSEIDRAVSKGVIHANAGSRKKSTLARQAQATQK